MLAQQHDLQVLSLVDAGWFALHNYKPSKNYIYIDISVQEIERIVYILKMGSHTFFQVKYYTNDKNSLRLQHILRTIISNDI